MKQVWLVPLHSFPSALAPHYSGSSWRAELHPLPVSLAPQGLVHGSCSRNALACSPAPLRSRCCPFGPRDSQHARTRASLSLPSEQAAA